MFTYRPHTLPQQFFIIGGGGTGGRLVPLLAQFLRSVTKGVGPRGWLMDPQIVIVDFDIVEEKNLLRQNFIAQDVGKHKATVLANRYARAFGVNIIPWLKRIDSSMFEGKLATVLKKDMPTEFIGQRDAMILMCVDSVKARKDILKAFAEMNMSLGSNPYFVIDAGNEDTFGQVKFFHLNTLVTSFGSKTSSVMTVEPPKMTPVKVPIPFIPLDLNYYDSIVDNQVASCADLDQTLAINASMATMMMGVVQNYMYGKPFTYGGRSMDLNGAGSTSYMDLNYVRRSVWFQKEEELSLLPEDSMRRTFPKVCAPAKPLVMKYISENNEKLLSMGIDPKTGKALEKFTAVSIIEEAPKLEVPVSVPVEAEAASVAVEPIAVPAVPAPQTPAFQPVEAMVANVEQEIEADDRAFDVDL
jgi:molybdopterin/thiamine biosynthesis adenylyltransferase